MTASHTTPPHLYAFSDIVRISQGLARSINIKRDFDDDEKVAHYVPTQAAEECLKVITDSTSPLAQNRARLVYGPYGGGKSHLGLVISRLVRSGTSYGALQPVLEKIAAGPHASTRDVLVVKWTEIEQESPKGYLTLVLHGNEGYFRDATLRALRIALEQHKLDDLMPRTVFTAAIDRIREWRRDFRAAYDGFERLLSPRGLTADMIVEQLRSAQRPAYELLCELHPQVAAGAAFNSDDLSRADEVYAQVAHLIRERGYAGIFVIWDEFGSYFEEACQIMRAGGGANELKEIEQFAEMCHGSRADQVHFLALAHRSLSEYAKLARLSLQALDEWKRIEGRFDVRSIAGGSNDRDVFELLSRIILHEPRERWEQFLRDGASDYFDRLAHESWKHSIFGDWQVKEIANECSQCYPLHPTLLYILPRLSAAIGQNERTLFTFTSYNDEGALPPMLEAAPRFSAQEPVTFGVDRLFAYFTPAIKSERQSSWEQYIQGMYEAGGEHVGAMERRILQVMTIWDAVRATAALLTTDRCRFALSLPATEHIEFARAIKHLKDLGIVYERQSDGALLFAGTDRQSIAKDLAEEEQSLADSHDPVQFLQDSATQLGSSLLMLKDVVPVAYQRKHKTQRTLQVRLVRHSDITEPRALRQLFNSVRDLPDGVMCYVMAQTAQELARAREAATAAALRLLPRVLLVLPGQPLEVSQLTSRLEALLRLRRKAPYNDTNSGPAQMVADYINTARKDLEDVLRPLYLLKSRNQSAVIYRGGSVVTELSEYDELEDYAAKLFEELFPANLAIGDEMLSRHPTTKGQYTNAAKRAVLNRILRFSTLISTLTLTQQETLDFGRTSLEFRLVRALLIDNGFLVKSVRMCKLGRPSTDPMAPHRVASQRIYDVVRDYFFKEHGTEKSVEPLIRNLSQPPYGLYSPALALLIAVAIHDRLNQIEFLKDGMSIDGKPLSDILDEMCWAPEGYRFITRVVTQEQRTFLSVLTTSVGGLLPRDSENPAGSAAAALARWYADLSPYARTTTSLSPEALALREAAARAEKDPMHVLVDQLPDTLGIAAEIEACAGDTSLLPRARHALRRAVEEVETCQSKIDQRIAEVVAQAFGISVPAPEETVLSNLRRIVAQYLDRADPTAVNATRSQFLAFQAWLERDHADVAEAFGELGLMLTRLRDRAGWTDSSLEIVRAQVTSIRNLLHQLPPRPEPPTPEETEYLEILITTLGGNLEAKSSDILAAAGEACRAWYTSLSPYARQTTNLPMDTRAFRNLIQQGALSPRDILLRQLPDQFGLQPDIRGLALPACAARLGNRLRELTQQVATAKIDVERELARLLGREFGFGSTTPDDAVSRLRAYLDARVDANGRLSKDLEAFTHIVQNGSSAHQVLQEMGYLYTGKVDPAAWREQDVRLVQIRLQTTRQAFEQMKQNTTALHVRLNVGGELISCAVPKSETVQQLANALTSRVLELVDQDKLRDDGKVLAVTQVLIRLMERLDKVATTGKVASTGRRHLRSEA